MSGLVICLLQNSTSCNLPGIKRDILFPVIMLEVECVSYYQDEAHMKSNIEMVI